MNKNIKVIPFPGIPNAYVVISGYADSNMGNGCQKCMSFFWGTPEGGAEWEPEYGPITKYTPCDKNTEGAQPHWFYEYTIGGAHWSQLAVENEGLPRMFVEGDYQGLFAVLARWSGVMED